MDEISIDEVIPQEFSGLVPLFPLPNLVAFPGVIQQLHIFEPRYCEMMKWTMGNEKLIAMAVLQPGWEGEYSQNPPIHPVVCIGKVVAHRKLVDGRYHLALLGGRRAKIEQELSAPQPFRSARVRLLNDHCQIVDSKRENLKKEIYRNLIRYLEMSEFEPQGIEALFSGDVSLPVLTDAVSSILPLDTEDKYQLLGETMVEDRANCLISRLIELSTHEDSGVMNKHTFPPNFSDN